MQKNYSIKKENKGNIIHVTLGGDLTLNNIKKLKDEFLTLLNAGKSVKIKIANVENIDLGFIQLFQSFIWTAKQSSTDIQFTLDLNDQQNILLSNAGITLKN